MKDYLIATDREDISNIADLYADDLLKADDGATYDEIVEIDLNTLEPHLNGPFTPDLATPISQMKDALQANNWPIEIAGLLVVVLIHHMKIWIVQLL